MKLDHIFLDFDETLFNHYKFLDWLDDQLHANKLLKGDKGSFKAVVDDYHEIVSRQPLHRLYQHEAHIEELTNQTWQAASEQIRTWLKQQKLDFCYSDAHALIKQLSSHSADVRILTFGDEVYQKFKIETCQYLAQHKLKIHVVVQDKALWLAANHKEQTGVLVDDKYPLELPSNWYHVWINRAEPLTEPKRLSKREIQIGSLEQVQSAVDTLTQN